MGIENTVGGWVLLRPDLKEEMDCSNCGLRFDPVACRWRCPSCGYKEHCCDS